MIKLIVGIKGTGKTKQLIDLANKAIETTKGAVICVEKGNKLMHEIKYQGRLVDVDEYAVTDAHMLYGFVCGMIASNSDITDLFIDSALKICADDMAEFIKFVKHAGALAEKSGVNIVITSSIPVEELPTELEGYTK